MKTITVHGTGHASAKPNRIQISFTLVHRSHSYEKVMNEANTQIGLLRDILLTQDFAEDALRTTDFSVDSKYEWQKKFPSDESHRTFVGFECTHQLSLIFPLDMPRLSRLISAIAESGALPEFEVEFLLGNDQALRDEALRTATKEAKHKAEILCIAAGGKLGSIQSIHYGFDDEVVVSHTDFDCKPMIGCAADTSFDPGMSPDDVIVDEDVTFIWEIV